MKTFKEWAEEQKENKQNGPRFLRYGKPISELSVGDFGFREVEVIVDIGEDYEYVSSVDECSDLLKERIVALEVMKNELAVLESYIAWRKENQGND